MKKSLLIAASLATMVTLSACGPGPAGPSPSPSASPSESASPSPEPSASPSESPSPDPSVTPTPEPSQSALPTPTPPANLGFSLTGATANAAPQFRTDYTITGTGLGAIADYKLLQIENSGATVIIVNEGVAKKQC